MTSQRFITAENATIENKSNQMLALTLQTTVFKSGAYSSQIAVSYSVMAPRQRVVPRHHTRLLESASPTHLLTCLKRHGVLPSPSPLSSIKNPNKILVDKPAPHRHQSHLQSPTFCFYSSTSSTNEPPSCQPHSNISTSFQHSKHLNFNIIAPWCCHQLFSMDGANHGVEPTLL